MFGCPGYDANSKPVFFMKCQQPGYTVGQLEDFAGRHKAPESICPGARFEDCAPYHYVRTGQEYLR